MSKYLRNYKDLNAAKTDETIVSPNMSSIENRKLIHLDTHVRGEELLVIGDSLENVRIVKKYIADTTSNPELIALARSLGWIDSGAEKMSVRDAMSVTTVNDEEGYSLLSSSWLKSFDEFEWFTGVTECPGYNDSSNYASLPNSCTSIKLPESITSIGDNAFAWCKSLSSITIPDSVTNIGERSFIGCSSLTSIEIPDSVTSIGDNAFCDNINLSSVTIGNSVTSIGKNAFNGCNSLESLTIPNSVTSIGERAFAGCSGLTSIEIPNSVEIISNNVFWNCVGLKSVTIGNGVTSIEDGTFYQCNNLESVTIGNSVESIGNNAFFWCGNLTSVKIPNSVESIGKYAFYYCVGLKSVTIPNRVTSIEEFAFEDCSNLFSVTCEALTPPTLDGSSVFENTNNCPIYVPTQSVDAYKEAWSAYADRIVCLLNNNQIRYTANSQLTIKDGVDYSNHTFDNGVGFVTFNNDLTALEDSWFDNTFDNYTDNIISLTLPNGVSSIGMMTLGGANTVYYEGTQKECARIEKSLIDNGGVDKYHCFDGMVDDSYQSNKVDPVLLLFVGWIRNLIDVETLDHLMRLILSVKIDEHPMNAGEFINMLVNGTQGIQGLSTYGFTVVNQDLLGVTVPLAYHTELGHFIGIAKATDYAQLDPGHLAPVAVNETLDPDYMYLLLDDTIISPDPEPTVDVTIEHENGTSDIVNLYTEQTYADQGYTGFYSQNTYDSNIGEMPEQFSVDNNYPTVGETIYDYCNDIYEPEPSTDVNVTIMHEDSSSETVNLNSDLTYAEQNYGGYYSQNTYDSNLGESADNFSVDNNYPYDGETIYNYCNDISS